MTFNVLFTVSRRPVAAGSLMLALSCMSAANAGNTFSGALPAGHADHSLPSPPREKSDLTLRDAALLALQRNPELAAFARETRALQGVTQQAGLLPNPDLVIMAENAGNVQKANNNPALVSAREVEQQETTIRLHQVIELGGKRAARVRAASLGEEVAGQDYEARRVGLIAQVANLFTEVLAGQERLRLAEGNVQLAQKVVNSVSKRVQAGKVPPIEETKVGVALSTTRIELEQARRDLAAARKRLALLWGNSSPQFNQVLGDLKSLVALPSFEVLAERVLTSPMALRAMKNIEQRKALLEVEHTRRVPNLTVIAGVLNHIHTGGTTVVAGISMPLQLFDRNQGNLREAHQRVDKAMDEQAATDLQLKTELAQTYEALSAAQNEIGILRIEVLPAARSAFDVTNRGYELGKFGFLEVLDAQRTLFQNEVLYVRALANYQRLVNEIERLIAAPIEGVSDGALSPPLTSEISANTDSRSGL
ncbi:outer membrane protein, cobalt-zinc-cadmium efflux system [Nitrosospira sp. Nl5]|uniref:TolC family protein n=1 Tax=Nitrosospira sp. Nl5 TaxID=200120 RepID=UPI000881A620|nr:TolC family protein [Nitrosospira sp. Nl5]SCY64148.1 outer membrane protein, cobalt-zinc-cadmium efflux system [Nitrosospira sp. Nl5]